MIHDVINIEEKHRRNASAIKFFASPGCCIAIGGESGSGKSETAIALREALEGLGMTACILQLDDYFKLPPRTNAEARRKNFSHVGPSEVDLALLDSHIRAFKEGGPSIVKPLVIFDANEIASEEFDFVGNDVLIVEGTYSLMLENADFRVYIEDRDVEARRHQRNRERQDAFLDKVLRREKEILEPFRKSADILLVDGSLSSTSILSSIAMFSIHGYFDIDDSTIGRTDTGGQVVHVTELAKQLARAGVSVDIYTRRFDELPCEEPKELCGVRLIRLPCGPSGFVRKEDLYQYLPEFIENCKAYIDSNCLRYDAFHGHYADGGLVAARLSEHYGIPFFFTAHSLGAWKRERLGDDASLNYPERIAAEVEAMSKCAAQSAYNTAQADKTCSLYPEEAARGICIIPSGIDVDEFRPSDDARNPLYADILCLGRLDVTKGHENLIRAFGKYVREYEDSCIDRPSVVICGGSSPLSQKEMEYVSGLMEVAREEGVANRVSFAGNVSRHDVHNTMASCRMFVLPSVSELMGMTVQEAMACGAVTLVSEHAGAAAVVHDRKDAFVFDPLDTESFALLISEVLELGRFGRFLSRMSREARALMVSEFSWESVCCRYLNMYRRRK